MKLTFIARACVSLAVAVAVQAGVAAAPASAHPFGPPSMATIVAEGSRVSLSWKAAEDDWVALGRSLGAFGDPAEGVDTTLTGEQQLARSAAVHDYLLSRVEVRQGGRPCEGALEPLERLVTEGARFAFACAEPVVEVDVRITALTDLNEAYRTVLTAETPADPAQTMLTAGADTRRLRFEPSAVGGVSLAVPAVVLVIAVAALVAFLVRGRRRRVGVAA
ncbi:hypothetical protein [Nonomuraea aridisoli]|uniref:Uncharacterized protein n=1 Tax=Nonomuraea aridisoli TaxID=2070368 RepID=A0A2W2DRC8_9ACTN|nr:hypothetical protein [Nonomuraea aridisoli]PZG14512.1 hypothetical protein C1J01_26710 [Nonomuraea aridisoli]